MFLISMGLKTQKFL